ncbi:MAG: GlxA family transcriptional regulator [Granulosicoccus sp.]
MDVSLSNMDIAEKYFPTFRVGFVLVDGFALMSYASAMEPLRAANLIAGRPLYDIRHMPALGARSTSSSGAIVGANTYLGEKIDFDLVLVVAGSDPQLSQVRRLEHWLRVLVSRNVLVGGVSAGPLILARAGVMEGHRLTVHWEHAQALRAVSSNLIVEKTLFVRDRGRLTCAGGTAAMDMMHALIAGHHGGRFAQSVSDWFLHTDVRPGENPQVAGLAERYGVSDIGVLTALQAMENHLDDPLTLTQISGIVGVSVRQVNRLFRQHLGRSTQDFYARLRLDKAQSLLRGSLLSVTDIAQATGFANTAHFSRQFRRTYGVSPSRYRTQAV